MQKIYYIGGSPCSGKSTIAEMLVRDYGFHYYKLDEDLEPFMRKAAEEGKPYSAVALDMSLEETWMRDPNTQSEEEFEIYEEMFPYVIDAIEALGEDKPIIAEGAGLLPYLIKNMNVLKENYICIVPTEDFQREKYKERPWIPQFLEGCSNPKQAFDNWMKRDAIFAKEALKQAAIAGYDSIVVDGKTSIEENYSIVKKTFKLK